MSNNKLSEYEIVDMATEIVSRGLTVRQCAKKYNVSKSTVSRYMRNELGHIDSNLQSDVFEVFDYNKYIGHLRGGMTTKSKFIANKLNMQM